MLTNGVLNKRGVFDIEERKISIISLNPAPNLGIIEFQLNLMRCFLQCSSPGIVASSEDCRKFWLCKEDEEGSRVLEVGIDPTRISPAFLHILPLQSLLYRCPPGYLFSTVIVRCAKQEEVSCPLSPPPEADFRSTLYADF